jgi:hypothetical protein
MTNNFSTLQYIAVALLVVSFGAFLSARNAWTTIALIGCVLLVLGVFHVHLRALAPFLLPIGLVVAAVVLYRVWQKCHIPMEVNQRREEVHAIQLELLKVEVCPIVVSVENPDSPQALHVLWIQYGPTARQLLSEEISDLRGQVRLFMRSEKVIASEQVQFNGTILQSYYRDDGDFATLIWPTCARLIWPILTH